MNIDRFDSDFWVRWENDFFRIYFQKDWVEVEPEIPIIKFQIQVPDDSDFFATVNVLVDNRIDNLESDEYVETIKPSLERIIFGFDNYKIEENSEEHITFYNISYTSKQEGVNLAHNQYEQIVDSLQ